MHKYLISLLKENNSAILPEIGSFMVDDGDISTVVFNAFLTFNDHALEGQMVKEENMDSQDAAIKVADWVREIQGTLNQGENYEMYGLGSLSKVDGQISFTAAVDSSVAEPAAPAPAPEPAKPEPAPSESEAEKEPAQNTFIPDPAPEKTPEEKPVKKAEKKPVKKAEKKAKPAKAKPAKAKKTKKEVEYDKNDPNGWRPTKEGSNKGKKMVMWSIILVLLFGGGGTAGWIFQDQLKDLLGLNDKLADKEEVMDRASTHTESTPGTDETMDTLAMTMDSTAEVLTEETVTEEPIAEEIVEEVVEEPVTEPEPVVTSAPASSGGSYHVIVGSFGVADNATNYSQTLKGKGYDASVAGTSGSLNLVSAGGYSSRADAQNAASRIGGELGVSAWVWKKR